MFFEKKIESSFCEMPTLSMLAYLSSLCFNLRNPDYEEIYLEEYVRFQLLVENAVSAQPYVGKLGISLVLLNFLGCNFGWWFETP